VNRSIIIAIVIALVALAWLGSGLFRDEIQAAINDQDTTSTEAAPTADAVKQDTQPAPEPTASEDRKLKVQTAIFKAQNRTQDIILRGRTDSARTVQLMAETSGSIIDLMKGKGETVKKGDRIARLSLQDREARRLEAVALMKQREIEHNAAAKLAAKGYKSETAVAAAGAQLDAAKAALKRMEVEIAQLTIRAPFEGTISKRHVQLGAFVGIGDPVVTIVDQDPILLVGNVSEREIGRIALGSTGRATLVDGREVEGKIGFISPTADEATRTFRVEVRVPNPDGSIRDGVTAEIRLAAGSAPAHLLSPAILTLSSAGEIGVRMLDSRNTTHFRPVTILSEGPKGIWVTGLPASVHLIVVGQEFVEDGQTVEIVRADQ
jgi:multidrug efflux system membrane fusion protein